MSTVQAALLGAAFAASCLGSLRYRGFAEKRGIVAHINSRTLHDVIVPRGGGVVFAGTFALAVVALWAVGLLPLSAMLCFGVGGGGAAAAGFVDDVHDVPALRKLAIQAALAAWTLGTFTLAPFRELAGASVSGWEAALLMAILFVPVAGINLYNFIDGIDGMAAGAAVFICAAAVAVLALTGGAPLYLFIFALLGAASLGFLPLNLPPAKMFMGDAGSIFLGYCFSALALATLLTGEMSVWTWLCMGACYLADTGVTFLLRLVLVKRWYGAHRSHAYQNLARILRSHARVTYGVMAFNLLWALPLALWSALAPRWAPLAALLALAPAVGWALRYGPLLSSD